MWTDKLTNEATIDIYKKEKSQKYVFKTVTEDQLQIYEGEWEICKELKSGYKLRKLKAQDILFENKVWMLFEKLGFKILNQDNKLIIPYKNEQGKQVDVFACDDDTALIVECKSAVSPKDKNFKTEIEALSARKEGWIRAVREVFPKRKVRIVFAVNDYNISGNDIIRLEQFGIFLMDNKVINYFYELQKHLGLCAKYQFLGTIFSNKKIENLETKVFAIQACMGRKDFFTFNIEPSKLLKLGYVLHRKDGVNSENLPTYQRIVKKNRLESVQNFIENNGYFPNSLIVSIDGTPTFYPTKKGDFQSRSKVGVLELPKNYRSIYIIDGQHRLYGYAGTSKADTETIPVVAFYNLTIDEQLKIFVDINENQKPIQKNLVNTLNADLLWDSKNEESVRKSLRLRAAQAMALDKKSPLYNSIQIGEDEIDTGKITMQAFDDGLSKAKVFNRYKRHTVVEHGYFDKNDKESTKEYFFPILYEYFNLIQRSIPDEWNRRENGLLLSNIGIYALIRIFGDVIEYFHAKDSFNPLESNKIEIISKLEPYVGYLSDYLMSISDVDRDVLRKNYGGNGKTYLWRRFQKELSKRDSTFLPYDLNQWWSDHMKVNNDEAYSLLEEIYSDMKFNIKELLQKTYGENWERDGLPLEVNKYLQGKKIEYQYKGATEEKENWDFIEFNNYRMIIVYKRNWSDIFSSCYSIFLKNDTTKDKHVATEWIAKLAEVYKKKGAKNYSVSDADLKNIKKVYNTLGMF